MSDSIPKPPSHRTKRRGALDQGRWTLLSALLHFSLLGIALLFPPVRNAIFQPRKVPTEGAEVRVEGERLAEVVEQVRDINRQELELRAAELEQIEREMADIQQEQAEQYREFAAEEAKTAAQRALQEQQLALNAQQTILETQQKSPDKDSHERIQQQQFVVDSAQTEAQRRIAMATPTLPAEVKETQAKANAAQEQTLRAQEQVRASVRDMEDQRDTVRRLTDELTKNQTKQTAAQDAVTAAETAHKETQQQVEIATAAVEQAKATTDRRAISDADSKLRRAKQAETSAESKVTRATKTLDEARQRTQAVQQKLDTANQTLASTQQQASQQQQAAEQEQRTARAAQQQARDTLAKVLETHQAKHAPVQGAVAETPTARQFADVAAMNIAQLYKTSVKTEEQITGTYKEIRSTELAQLRGITIEEARQITDVPRPVRPALNEQVLRAKITTAPEYQKHSDQIQTALRETAAMVSLGESLLDLARALRKKDEQGVSVALAAAGQTQQMEKMAHEVAGGKVVDLAGLMAKAGGGDEHARLSKPDNEPPPKRALTPPNIPDPKTLQATRQVLPTAGTAGWVYVDTWYTIGPFPNPNRVNIHRRFPPETVVDLDASYVGKDNRVIRWMFAQAGEPMCRPYNEEEYGIWYSYTELRFDRARDLWIAVGSDDRSDLWINGQRVWSSSDILKAWSINEGFRRVHFEAGINRILYRVENGWHAIAYSLCIYTGAES